MQLHLSLAALALLSFPALIAAQVAAGGGNAATSTAATQMATTTVAGSLFTNAGTTSATWIAYTQTFSSPLGTWAFATPSAGTIGLGSISGTPGATSSSKS